MTTPHRISDIFACACCGFCCHGETTVSLDERDQERMIKSLGLTREEVREQNRSEKLGRRKELKA
jgi:hypothetical protein